MFTNLYLLVLSLLPAGLFLGLIRSRVPIKSTSEPYFAALTFIGGMVVAPISFFLFVMLSWIHGLEALNAPMAYPIHERAILSFFVISPLEEVLKIWPVILMLQYRKGSFRPVDAISCAAASGLGFAAMENWYAMYSIGGADYGRILVIPFIHMLLTAVSGHGLAISLKRGKGLGVFAWFLLAAILLHGLYDSVEMIGGWVHFVLLPVVAVLYYRLSTDLNILGRIVQRKQKKVFGSRVI